jgi:5-methylcytosine-specific restriction endonuclease McrA
MKEVNHKKPFDGIDDPLRLDWDNLESLCLPCHRKAEYERKKHAK